MTKKEQALVAELEKQIRLLKAWRLTEGVKPDIAPPNAFEDISYGYHAHAYALNWRVERAASGSTFHYTGDTSVAELQKGVNRYYPSGSQNAIWLFSTRSAALRAARHQIERHVIEALAKLDAEIAAAQSEEQA
ncbi:hypothetical protein UFOVP398_64 [uncultured Caudovirales phage]|uniref:Uncharacterized protein n=1 Tax=uncultured Caudovirales phage TaxID=2100421 RepID=A0A6J5M6H0_9CAUD|nr:hypothetical protein UFOVP398_64 [uncultured Caudovirales phage]